MNPDTDTETEMKQINEQRTGFPFSVYFFFCILSTSLFFFLRAFVGLFCYFRILQILVPQLLQQKQLAYFSLLSYKWK